MKKSLLLVALIAVAVTACAPAGQYAAKVNGEVIPISAIESDIRAVTSNPGFADSLNQQFAMFGQRIQPGGPNTISAQYVATTPLSFRVVDALMRAQLERYGVTVTPDQRRAAEEQLKSSIDQFDTLDTGFREFLVGFHSRRLALGEARSTPERQRAFYDANQWRYEETCFRLLSVRDAAAAAAVRDRVIAGDDFATLARQVSGGAEPSELCWTGEQLEQAGVRDLVAPVPVNGVSGPILQRDSAALVQIISRTPPPPFEQVQPQVEQALASDLDLLVQELYRGARIEVNPRYGEYRPAEPADLESGSPATRAAIVPLTPVTLDQNTPSGAP